MDNKWRLLVMCNLVDGKKSVGELQRILGVSRSALSQRLATLRAKKLVAVRREAQSISCRLNGPEVAAVLTTPTASIAARTLWSAASIPTASEQH
jgi:ArsR family transcriptional regulator, virulence genes transcriptional regulator